MGTYTSYRTLLQYTPGLEYKDYMHTPDLVHNTTHTARLIIQITYTQAGTK